MSKRLRIYVVFISSIVFCCKQLRGQDLGFEDSLLSVLRYQKEDSAKVLTLLSLAQSKMGAAQDNGNWDEPIKWFGRSLSLSTKINYQYGIMRSNGMTGICYEEKGDYTEAIKYFYTSLQLNIKNGRPTGAIANSRHLGRCYMRLGNYEEALKNFTNAYNKQVSIHQDQPLDPRQIAVEIAAVYEKMNNWDQALNWYKKSLPYDAELFYAGDYELHVAYVQIEMRNYDEALKNLRLGILLFPGRFDVRPDMEIKGIKGMFYQQFGEAWFKLGQLTKDSEKINAFQESIDNLKKAVELLKDGSGSKELLLSAYSFLKQACEGLNDYQDALYYSNVYTELKDSIYSKETYVKLADQQTKFETEKAKAEMKAKQEIEEARDEKLVAYQKLEQEKILSNERMAHAKEMNDQKLREQKSVADQKRKYDNSIAEEKTRQAKLNAEKQRMNNLLFMGLILVIITLGFLVLFLRQRQLRKRAIEKTETVQKMAELELQSLRSQLNPHFMFNSLNSLQRLILMEESDKSQSYLARFSKMLRMLLENADKPFIPLQKEIDFLQLYLGLEKLRVPDLEYSISTDPVLNADQTMIPNMILQPYVENAIWHGLSHKENDKQLQIRIYRENGNLNCEIEDNGVGRKKAEELKSLFRKEHKSKGMELLTKRFRLLNEKFGSEIQSKITDLKSDDHDMGVLVTVRIPIMLSRQSQN